MNCCNPYLGNNDENFCGTNILRILLSLLIKPKNILYLVLKSPSVESSYNASCSLEMLLVGLRIITI